MSTSCKVLGAFIPTVLIVTLAVSPALADPITWHGPIGPASNVDKLAIDPLHQGTLYAAAANGMFKTIDGGTNWEDLNFHQRVSALVIDPHTPDTLYAAGEFAAYASVFKSTDGGNHWSRADAGIDYRRADVPTLIIDPNAPGTLYISTNTPAGNVHKSTDGGAYWNPLPWIDQTLRERVIATALAIDPRNSAILYAGTAYGVYKSTDGGNHWTRKITGFVDTSVSVLLIDPLNSSKIYAGMDDTGIFVSVDGGDHWNPINNGLPNLPGPYRILDLTTVSRFPSLLYAALLYSCVFESADGGNHWNNTGLYNPFTLAVDAHNPVTIYAGTPQGVFLGETGLTWNPTNWVYLPMLTRQ